MTEYSFTTKSGRSKFLKFINDLSAQDNEKPIINLNNKTLEVNYTGISDTFKTKVDTEYLTAEDRI